MRSVADASVVAAVLLGDGSREAREAMVGEIDLVGSLGAIVDVRPQNARGRDSRFVPSLLRPAVRAAGLYEIQVDSDLEPPPAAWRSHRTTHMEAMKWRTDLKWIER